MVTVPVETEPTFAPGQAEVLFSATGFRSLDNHAQYDVTLDDERFIMIRQAGEAEAGEMIVVTNWFEELRQRVGSN